MITVDKYADLYPELIFNSGDLAAARGRLADLRADGIFGDHFEFRCGEPGDHGVLHDLDQRRLSHRLGARLDL